MRGGGVGLDEVLADRVLLVARHGAGVRRGLDRRALVEQLVREHDPRETHQEDGIADLRLAGADADRRVDALRDAQQREVPPGPFQDWLVGVVEEHGRAELLHLRGELGAVGEQHRHLRQRRELRRGERPIIGVAPDLVLDIGPLPSHEAARLQRRLDAGLLDGRLLELVDHPRR